MSSVRVPNSLRRPGSLRRPAVMPASTATAGRKYRKPASSPQPVSRPRARRASRWRRPPATTTAPAQRRGKGRQEEVTRDRHQIRRDAAAPVPAAAPEPTPDQKIANPYADPNAPYKVDRSASGKLTEPLVNTPKTVTALPKEVIEDKGARDLRDLARSVPGLTIGSAEGGNAYGAFAIRGFKANNDIFVDSIRNPGNLIPDAFSVEQVEIYKGPSGGIAGRNTIGGAVNVISKQPSLDLEFLRGDDDDRHRQHVPHDSRCQQGRVPEFRGARQHHVRSA